MTVSTLRLTADMAQRLNGHLFPGDGKEAVALVLCGRRTAQGTSILCGHEVLPIPHELCIERTPVRVQWPTDVGLPLFTKAMQKNMAVLKIHSHGPAFPDFSAVDDASDMDLFRSLHGWTDDGLPHASAIMFPDGRITARGIGADLSSVSIDRVTVVGDNIRFHDADTRIEGTSVGEADLRNRQMFGDATVRLLRTLKIGVVGCSGTGSWVVEQLARLGVGHLVLVDPDIVEHKNLNRIVNSFERHAQDGAAKVHVLDDAIRGMGFGTQVTALAESTFNLDVLKELATCDVLFGCMDKVEGRDLLNRVAATYCVPYFDLGVHLKADGKGGVEIVCGSVHYLLPDGSSLMSRGVYTAEDLRREQLQRTQPEQFANEVAEGYIKNANVESPAVVSVNGLCATLAINNFLARLHPFRIDSTREIRHQVFDLVNGYLIPNPDDGHPCPLLGGNAGRGDMEPFLGVHLA